MTNNTIEIITMSDYQDCEQCGGNSEDGGVVKINGEVVFEHIPNAACFGNNNYYREDLLVKALESFGYQVVFGHEDYYEDEE